MRNPGSESQLCHLTAGGVKLCNLTWKGWILIGTWKPLQEMVLWSGLVEKSCQHGTALQMAALSPIILTQADINIHKRGHHRLFRENSRMTIATRLLCQGGNYWRPPLCSHQALAGDGPVLPLQSNPGAHPQRLQGAGEVSHLY